MIEVADIFRRLACRTEALGGHLWRCDHCPHEVFSYHSCKNRSCCKCHTGDTERWLEARKLEMLPCHYFLSPSPSLSSSARSCAPTSRTAMPY